MIDVTGRIFQCLAINRVTVRQMKDIDIASGSTPRAFSARNLLPNVLHDPRTLLDVLSSKEALPGNPRWTNTYLNFNKVTELDFIHF
jgi:hypothetical protein